MPSVTRLGWWGRRKWRENRWERRKSAFFFLSFFLSLFLAATNTYTNTQEEFKTEQSSRIPYVCEFQNLDSFCLKIWQIMWLLSQANRWAHNETVKRRQRKEEGYHDKKREHTCWCTLWYTLWPKVCGQPWLCIYIIFWSGAMCNLTFWCNNSFEYLPRATWRGVRYLYRYEVSLEVFKPGKRLE